MQTKATRNSSKEMPLVSRSAIDMSSKFVQENCNSNSILSFPNDENFLSPEAIELQLAFAN